MPQHSAPSVEGLPERSITEYDSGALSREGVTGVGGVLGVDARVRAFGAILVIEAWGVGSEIERRPLRPGFPSIDIIFVERGEFEYLDAGAWRRSRGPLLIAPSGLPYRVRFISEWKFVVARVPREAMLAYVPMFTDSVGIYGDLTMPERGMHAFLSHAVRSESQVSEADSRTVDRQVLDMAGTLVLGRSGQALSTDTPRGALRNGALRVISERSSDPEFSPEAVAKAVNSSLRRLQEIFAEAGSTVAAEIRRERARLARSLLQDSRFDDLSTGEIAGRSGFGSSASLRRALDELYRLTPRELRGQRAAS